MSEPSVRPITVLIAAMGGEGGGVLTDWVVKAAEHAGLLVQSTSIPGVAQRTGATTYYVEIFPIPIAELDGREPVFALYPSAGDVDLMIASELLEAGRAIQNGYVSPDRTVLIASTHRVYTIGERSDMADGRLDEGPVRRAAQELSRRALLSDFKRAADKAGSVMNAVLLGTLAATSVLPMVKQDSFVAAIRAGGKAIASNLTGFEAGFQLAMSAKGQEVPTQSLVRPKVSSRVERLINEVKDDPVPVREIIEHGLRRLESYQDLSYARLYLTRVSRVRAVDTTHDKSLTQEAARQLALRMAYEDVVRVAQLKTARERMDRVRAEIKAAPGEPVRVTEFLKPGIEEICSLLPGAIARPLLRWAENRNLTEKLHIGLALKTSSVTGFLAMWLLARLRPIRRLGYRFREEQLMIDAWLHQVCVGAQRAPELAREIISCARLIKGYGETHRRGYKNYERIQETLIAPALDGDMPFGEAVDAIEKAVAAALDNPDGSALSDVLLGTADASKPAVAHAAE